MPVTLSKDAGASGQPALGQMEPDWLGQQPRAGFCHQAFFYAGRNEFVQALESFVRAGLATGDKVLVVLMRS